MSSPAVASSFFLLAITSIWVLAKKDEPRAIQVSLIASIIAMLLVAVDGLMPGGVPAIIFVPLGFALFSVMIVGLVQGYGVRRQNLKEEQVSFTYLRGK